MCWIRKRIYLYIYQNFVFRKLFDTFENFRDFYDKRAVLSLFMKSQAMVEFIN